MERVGKLVDWLEMGQDVSLGDEFLDIRALRRWVAGNIENFGCPYSEQMCKSCAVEPRTGRIDHHEIRRDKIGSLGELCQLIAYIPTENLEIVGSIQFFIHLGIKARMGIDLDRCDLLSKERERNPQRRCPCIKIEDVLFGKDDGTQCRRIKDFCLGGIGLKKRSGANLKSQRQRRVEW